MDILYWFESIRNPVLNSIFSIVTYLGHEIIPVALICIIYWCVNKGFAYRIGFSFFASGITTQALKISFRIPRPWIIDNNFSVVDDAKSAASSYSFPSGHTQAATSVYSSLALLTGKLWLRILLVSAFILVAVSRMYLGVHTLNDVVVAMVLSLIMTFVIFRIMDAIGDNRRYDIVITLIMLVLSVALIIYAYILTTVGKIDKEHISALNDCVKTGASGIALAIGYYIERRYINFDVRAKNVKMHALKVVIGLGAALGLKEGLKLLIGESPAASFFRYFILIFFIIVIYPLIIKNTFNKDN